MVAPILVKAVPAQAVNEQAAFGPLDLKDYITVPNQSSTIRFQAELLDGTPLPKGLICTEDGILNGFPAKGTQGNHEIKIIASNEDGQEVTRFVLTIKPSLGGAATDYVDQLKAQVWEALEHKMPVPDIGSLYERPVTMSDVYYLLERFASLTIWDALNLDPPGNKNLLTPKDANPHFNIYDCGSCLVAAPKDLFSHERTLNDALQTARIMAREVYQRGWVIELAGFEKMERAAWVELQHLEDIHGKKLEILHYDPTFKELRIYTEEAKVLALKRAEQR